MGTINATRISDSDVEISDEMDGDVAGRTITVLESGNVHGSLGARTIIIRGRVNGTIHAESIEISATGHVEGELQYQTLTVDPGAEIEARCTPTLNVLDRLAC